MGTLASVASLTFCLAMTATSAFVLRVPKVTPPPLPHPSLRRQALGVDGGETGAGGALSRGGGNDGAEAKKIILPWVPFVENYVEVRSRITRPLHVFMGVEVRAYFCTASKPCLQRVRKPYVYRLLQQCSLFTNLSGNIRDFFVLP